MPDDSHVSEESFDFTELVREYRNKQPGKDPRDREGYVLLSGVYGDCYYSNTYWNSLTENEKEEEFKIHYPGFDYLGFMTLSGGGF